MQWRHDGSIAIGSNLAATDDNLEVHDRMSSIDNVQTSWVKINHELAQLSLRAGCNDFGGTLMEEQITKSAGGDAGEYIPVETIRALIEAAGRIPEERTTTYGRVSPDGAHATSHGAGWGSGRSPLLTGPQLAS